MKVLLVNKFARVTGGADLHCLWLATALRERGHEVQLLSTTHAENIETEGFFVRPSVMHSNREDLALRSRPGVLARALWNREAASAARRVLADWRPDVVHSHKLYPQLSVAPVVEASRAGVPVVQTLHDFELVSAGALDARGRWLDEEESRLSYRALNTATLPLRRHVHARRVSAFVAVSRFVARIYRRHGIESNVLPNFVPGTDAPPEPLEGRNGIAFVGRLTADKGIHDILALAGALPDVPVTVVGTGTLEHEVRSAAARLPNLVATGFVPPSEVSRIVAHAQLVALPSLCHEAAGLVAVEAMAAGTPVVAYASGGLAEYVGDAGCGLVVPRDPVTLATACRRLLDDPPAWSVMSKNGLEAARTTHASDRYVSRLVKTYETVSSRGAFD